MAYIVKMKNREGKEYVYLKEGYRDGDKTRTRTLKAYGQYDLLEKKEPGIYERLREEAKLGLLTNEVKKSIQVNISLLQPIEQSSKNFGWKLLEDVFNHLEISKVLNKYSKSKKFEFDLDSITKLLVFQRCLNPSSKLETINSQSTLFGNWNNKVDDCYRSLEHLNSLKEKIQCKIHEVVTKDTNRTATLVFYDVTNYYFDCDFNDEDVIDENGEVVYKALRKRGPSKEKKPKPIVQMGMFVDLNGIPIAYKLFPGNHTDPITYIPAIEQVKKQFGIERIITVADKAMNSAKNITDAHNSNDGWLFSSKVRGARGVSKDLQEFALNENNWEYNLNISFAKKSMIRKRKLSTGKTVEEKVLVTWNEKYDRREKIRRNGALEYAAKLTNAELFRQTAKKGGKKYLNLEYEDPHTKELKPFNPFITIDFEQVKEDEKFDGLNVLVTSEINMSDDDMINSYRQLHKIEDCFRVTKSDIQSRPVYVRRDEHIEAHFLTCFISLTILRYIKHMLNNEYSEAKIINALKSATCINIASGYERVESNELMQEINKSLNIDFRKQNVETEKVINYSKNWCTTFLKIKKETKTR